MSSAGQHRCGLVPVDRIRGGGQLGRTAGRDVLQVPGRPQTEVGVKVFGPVHGGIFIAFVVAALLVGIARKWARGHVVAGVAGQHRAAGQCDLPHLGGSGRAEWVRPPRVANRSRRSPNRRDRLDGVTRPRPSIGPALAGAVDLSALKQPPPSECRRGPARCPGAASRSPKRTSKPRCWPAPTSCRSSCCCGHRAATPASNWATSLAALAARRRRQVVAGDGQRRHHAADRADVRRAGRSDGRRAGGRPAAVELPGRAAARAAAPLGRLAAECHGGQAWPAGPKARPRRSTPKWSRRARIWTTATSTRRSTAYQAILDANPGHPEAKGAVRQIVVPQAGHHTTARRRGARRRRAG